MGNVWEAMKKHQAEQAQGAPPAGRSPMAGEGPPPGAGEPAAEAAGDALPAQALRADEPQPAAADLHPATADGYARCLVAHHDRGGKITEEYRALRTNLLAKYHDEQFCLVVTSAEAGEGKTVTCLNLAFVLSEREDRRTLVIDCDLRRGKLARLLRVADKPGMADLLRGPGEVTRAIRATPYPNLFAIPAGQARANEVGELLGRPTLQEIMAQVRRRFDYVLLDAPPINIVPDASILGRVVGEAILVVRMNKTRRESVNKAIRLLHAANIKAAGIVLTHQRYYIPGYLYRYS